MSAGHAGNYTCVAPLEGKGAKGYGFHDFFELGAMAGGWDEAAVAAKGLPTSGDLPITMTVSEVAHMGRVPALAQGGVVWHL